MSRKNIEVRKKDKKEMIKNTMYPSKIANHLVKVYETRIFKVNNYIEEIINKNVEIDIYSILDISDILKGEDIEN